MKSLCGMILTFTLLVSSTAIHATAEDQPADLLRLVRSDVGMCIVAEDSTEKLQQLTESDLARRLTQSSLWQEWISSRQFDEFQTFSGQVETLTGRSPATLADELFGQFTLLALYPVAGEEPSGILITRLSNTQAIDKLLKTWTEADRVEVPYRQIDYFRLHTEGKKPEFYCLFGDVLALTDKERVIQGAIDLHLAAGRTDQSDAPQTLAECRAISVRRENCRPGVAIDCLLQSASVGFLAATATRSVVGRAGVRQTHGSGAA